MDGVLQVVAVEPVDITGSTAAARADAEKYRAEDPPYAELMATLAALGDLLDTDPDPAECAALLQRVDALDRTVDYQACQRWVRWSVRTMNLERVA
ncbi:hypothetical protein QRX60_16945 [Amycolatopsis mongoliensis]|uniref:Uncharacterized protein n=1 Tax=Amycolatopsis mongoliensis TaxID=715475 RepID=A0A9Y2NH47_9PSEU|nr:hypothetical protein [Amycolatopsis sp. 4-36]WIY05446.1 hypothetical protein QRX60_16945 [Amycolatopsis sp. 4-36]